MDPKQVDTSVKQETKVETAPVKQEPILVAKLFTIQSPSSEVGVVMERLRTRGALWVGSMLVPRWEGAKKVGNEIGVLYQAFQEVKTGE